MKKRALSLLLVGLLSISSVMPALAAAPEEKGIEESVIEETEEGVTEEVEDESTDEAGDEITKTADKVEELKTFVEPENAILEVQESVISEDSDENEEVNAEEENAMSQGTASFSSYDESGELTDNEELFAGYVNQLFDPYAGMISLFSLDTRSTLSEANQMIYDEMYDMAMNVADGKIDSSQLIIEDELTFTVDELGLDYAWKNDVKNPGLDKALFSYLRKPYDALGADHPYVLYWHDKSSTGGFGLSWSYYGEEDYVTLVSLNIEMCVSADYSVNGVFDTTSVDVSKTGAAKSALANAQQVIKDAAWFSDYDKLDYYRQWICDHNTYNTEAADDDNNVPYGDPWQLIYVFDGLDNTNVVCEGYAKAFQYLCDHTNFVSPEIYCYTVEGNGYNPSGGGPHMWNIMHMDDGYNYHTDITWCDPVGGAPGAVNRDFFLIGAKGMHQEGVYYYRAGNYSYRFGTGNMMSLYSKEDLTIKIGADYDPDYNPVVPERPLQMESFSLGLNDTGIISLYIYMSGLKDEVSEVYIDGYLAEDCSEMKYDKDLYRYTIQKAVKDIYEDVTISVYENDELVPFEDGTYINADGEAVVSIYDYIDVVTANEEKKFSQELVDLCQALLVCGDNAKGYFDSEYTSTMESDYSIYPDEDGNDPLEDYDAVFVRPSDNYSGEGSDPGAGLTFEHAYAGSSLILGSTVTVRHYFTEDVRNLSDESESYNENWFYKKKADSIYYAQFGVEDKDSLQGYRGLPVADLHKWTVADFDGFQIEYSPFCYMKKARDAGNASAELLQLMNSLYGLWHYADVYFAK